MLGGLEFRPYVNNVRLCYDGVRKFNVRQIDVGRIRIPPLRV